MRVAVDEGGVWRFGAEAVNARTQAVLMGADLLSKRRIAHHARHAQERIEFII